MPMPKYFFVYVVIVDGRIESHVVGGDNWDTLIRTKAIVQNGVVVSNLLYLSNVKKGTHHERLVRGEVPPQKKSPYRVDDLMPRPPVTPEVCPQFVNAGIGLSPDSICSYCKGVASDHPDMEIPLSVMARVRMASKCVAPGCEKTSIEGSSFCLAHKDAYGEMARVDHRDFNVALDAATKAHAAGADYWWDGEGRKRWGEKPAAAAPCEDVFQGGASGEAGPHLKLTGEMVEVDIRDPDYGVGAQSVEEERPGFDVDDDPSGAEEDSPAGSSDRRYECAVLACRNDAARGSAYCSTHGSGPHNLPLEDEEVVTQAEYDARLRDAC